MQGKELLNVRKKMKFRECCKLIKKDWDSYKYNHKSTLSIMTNPTFALVFWFRIGSWIYQKKNICVKICSIPIRIIYKTITLLTGIQLPLGTCVGGYQISPLFLHSNRGLGENR